MTVADPGFPRGDVNPRGGSTNLLFVNIFAKNCMEMKEIGSSGGTRIYRPPRPANAWYYLSSSNKFSVSSLTFPNF